MSTIYKPPEAFNLSGSPSVFLAGNIDNGSSIDWQRDVEDALSDLDVVILNPRRDNWDSTCEQSIHNDKFKEQVDWELKGLDEVDYVFMYLAPGSLSPISLLELGLHVDRNPIVVCPDGFWRKGNVEVVANKYDFEVHHTLQDGINKLRSDLVYDKYHAYHSYILGSTTNFKELL